MHFSAHLRARAFGAFEIELCFVRDAIKTIPGMALAGDLACFRIGSPAAAVVAAACVQVFGNPRRRSPSSLPDSRIPGHFQQRMGNRDGARHQQELIQDALAGRSAGAQMGRSDRRCKEQNRLSGDGGVVGEGSRSSGERTGRSHN